MKYEYDSKFEVLIRMGKECCPQVISKGDTKWVSLLGNSRFSSYERAIYLGEGCWERLNSISEEEARSVLENWGCPAKIEDK